MRRVWGISLLLAVMAALGFRRWEEASAAVLAAGNQALTLGMTLIGGMMIWGGLMAILQESGAMGAVSRWVRGMLRPLVRRELSEESWAAMGMNLAANLLGLGNAATPFGIRAAQLLARQGEDGLRGLLVLLVINNSGLELMPSAVMTLRQQAGSVAPGAVWLPPLAAMMLLIGLVRVGGLAEVMEGLLGPPFEESFPGRQ